MDDILKCSLPFDNLRDFSPLINKIKDKKIVMFGEATHGTSEFYEWRNKLTMELIQNHGFHFVSVEGDWPACQEINNFVNTPDTVQSYEVLSHFSRWPTWMWANDEIIEFMEKLQGWNLSTGADVGFHGLDVYSLYESMNQVVNILNEVDPELSSRVKSYYSCFDPYLHDEKLYAGSLLRMPEGCEDQVSRALSAILGYEMNNDELFFDLKQNAKIIQNAESYYRTMVFDTNRNSWNVRDEHMLETLESLLHHYGPESKGIVWAHNTHIGDYRATDMIFHGHVNLGGLARKKFGEENVSLVGFSTYTGTVVASHAWGGPIEVMDVPEANKGSLEYLLHQHVDVLGSPNFFMDLSKVDQDSNLNSFRGHRAIGVVYDPKHEVSGNYVPTAVAQRYNFLIHLDETRGLSPLGFFASNDEFPETYPYDDIP